MIAILVEQQRSIAMLAFERIATKLMERQGMVRIERANVADVPHIKQVLSETWLATYSAFDSVKRAV